MRRTEVTVTTSECRGNKVSLIIEVSPSSQRVQGDTMQSSLTHSSNDQQKGRSAAELRTTHHCTVNQHLQVSDFLGYIKDILFKGNGHKICISIQQFSNSVYVWCN